MGRSMMYGGVPLFICFAVLATLINAAIEIQWKDGIPWVYNHDDIPETNHQPRPLYEKDGFLAGEETPVWFADVQFDGANRPQYTYSRLNTYGTPMVRESLDHWNSLKKTGGFPLRRMRSINDRENLTSTGQVHDAPTNAKIGSCDSPSPVEKQSGDNEVVYPSLLVVMDYDDVPLLVDNLLRFRWSAEQLVTYALAFWGTVDSSLRNIQNPRVSLRISGIVITKTRQATPYLNSYYVYNNIFAESLSPMIDYWRSVSKKNDSQFPIGSYDIVVHMTDICPWSLPQECTVLTRQHNPSLSAASHGPPCKLADQIGGIIIYDDIAFNGLQRAIVQMSKALGGSDEIPLYSESPRRKWTKNILDSFSKALKNTSCMSAPKQLHRSGKPVPPILAGEFMSNAQQCEAAGYKPNAWTCWDTSYTSRVSNCDSLKCSNQFTSGLFCSDVGPTLDGTFCNADKTKICLDGKCVNKK